MADQKSCRQHKIINDSKQIYLCLKSALNVSKFALSHKRNVFHFHSSDMRQCRLVRWIWEPTRVHGEWKKKWCSGISKSTCWSSNYLLHFLIIYVIILLRYFAFFLSQFEIYDDSALEQLVFTEVRSLVEPTAYHLIKWRQWVVDLQITYSSLSWCKNGLPFWRKLLMKLENICLQGEMHQNTLYIQLSFKLG